MYSAGIEAHGVNPLAVRAIQEVGIDISKQTSDTIDEELVNRATYVITLCGDANDKFPHITRWDWGFDDPATAEGT